MTRVPSHAQDIERHSQIDTSRVRGTRYLFEFDRELQCPTWGYPTEGAYCEWHFHDILVLEADQVVLSNSLVIHLPDETLDTI